MMRSGRKVPTPAIPMPDFAVPYAAPMQPKAMAAKIPACSIWLDDDCTCRCANQFAGYAYHSNERGELGRSFGIHIGRLLSWRLEDELRLKKRAGLYGC